MSGPLAGIRILDLSQVIAGPYGPALLADSGAETIKIEPLGGEMARTSLGGGFYGLNRGKRSLPLNLQSDEGRDILYRLVQQADVLVENFRPGVMDRLKLGYDVLSALNPRLVFVSVTAFGSDGPYAKRPGFDPLLQAFSGIERAQGGRHNPPTFMQIPITDHTTALMQAASITLALFNRERTGRGCHLNLSLLRSALFVNADAFLDFPGNPGKQLPDAGLHGLGPLDRMYQAGDGGWWFLVLPPGEAAWGALTGVPGLTHLAADGRFAGEAARAEHADDLAEVLASAFAAGPCEAWLAALEAAGVPCAPVVVGYQPHFFSDEQPLSNNYFVMGDHPTVGSIQQVGNLLHFSATPTEQELRMAPLLGQHTDELLGELGFSGEQVAGLRERGVTL